jgi:hypothetical protein
MSERKPVSVYLSPRAQTILDEFTKYSGYGSTSRTVEEIILAYNDIYNVLKNYSNMIESSDIGFLQRFAVVMITMMLTIIKRVFKD